MLIVLPHFGKGWLGLGLLAANGGAMTKNKAIDMIPFGLKTGKISIVILPVSFVGYFLHDNFEDHKTDGPYQLEYDPS